MAHKVAIHPPKPTNTHAHTNTHTLHSDELRQETAADVRVVLQPDKLTLGNSQCVFSQGQ